MEGAGFDLSRKVRHPQSWDLDRSGQRERRERQDRKITLIQRIELREGWSEAFRHSKEWGRVQSMKP
jgi:hypothetical protein